MTKTGTFLSMRSTIATAVILNFLDHTPWRGFLYVESENVDMGIRDFNALCTFVCILLIFRLLRSVYKPGLCIHYHLHVALLFALSTLSYMCR